MYEADEEYDGPPYASQPMLTGKHGASYTPPGWKRKRVKRAKLYLTLNLRSQMIALAVIMTGEHLLTVYSCVFKVTNDCNC